MSAQDQVRALMVRHHHLIRNREQSMLSRAACELGMPAEAAHTLPHGKANPGFSSRTSYDRSNVGLS